jgi:glucosylceramidase
MNRRFRPLRQVSGVIILAGLLAACSKDTTPDPGPPPSSTEIGKASVYVTTGDQSKLLHKENDISVVKAATTTTPVINIDASQKFQEIEGFGAALTGSSAYLINRELSAGNRAALLKDLFDPETGIGITYLRVTMGASDFSLADFTYDDVASNETDFDLDYFTIEKDLDDVVPVLQQINGISSDVQLMATPWSPPAWMKTNGSLKGGKLKTDCYDVYADYFVRYIQAFEDEDIVINAITPQNEPLYATAPYPCMEMQPGEQATFIKNHLGPAFETAGLDTKIIVYDHNWDHPEYATTILNDAAAKAYVAGSAFHAYAGNVSAMSTVHAAHPDRGLYFTEITGTDQHTVFSDNLQWNMDNIFIGTTKNWSKTALLWNLALDENHGPRNNGCPDCRGVVTINTSGQVTRNVEYYSIGHFSKFIRPGATRIASSISSGIGGVNFVSFVNSDGSRVLVISYNGGDNPAVVVKDGDAQFSWSLSPKSVTTVTWKL